MMDKESCEELGRLTLAVDDLEEEIKCLRGEIERLKGRVFWDEKAPSGRFEYYREADKGNGENITV